MVHKDGIGVLARETEAEHDILQRRVSVHGNVLSSHEIYNTGSRKGKS